MKTVSHKFKRIDILYTLSLGFLLWLLYNKMIISPQWPNIEVFLRKYIDNSIGSPYRYRILIPGLYFMFCEFADLFLELTHQIRNLIFSLILCFSFLFGIYNLKLFYDCFFENRKTVIIALLLSTIFVIPTFFYHFFQPWSYLDIGLFALGLRWIISKQTNVLYLLILTIIACLNRETGIFIAISYFVYNYSFKRLYIPPLKTMIPIIIAFTVLIILRLVLGYSINDDSSRITETLQKNLKTEYMIDFIYVLIGSGILFSIPTKKIVINEIGKLYISYFLFLVPVILFGVWKEFRMLLPFLPLIIIGIIDRMGLYEKKVNRLKNTH